MEQNTVLKEQKEIRKPRKPFIAFLLSLLFPGLGQIYNGQLLKGVILFAILMLLPLLFGITRSMTTFNGMIAAVLIEMLYRIYMFTDAIICAKRRKAYILRKYNRWYYHMVIAIGMLVITGLYDLQGMLGVQTFKIPTTANHPTLQVGDWFVADLKAYNNSGPECGDLVVFKKRDGQTYVYRVIGLPGDKLELNDDIVTINGKPSGERFIKDVDCDGMPVSLFEEVLPNGHRHLVQKSMMYRDSTMTDIRDIIVPPGSYYLLGDNRDNAADSRYEGFVSKSSIIGRVIYSYWGKSTDRIYIDFRNK